ncbi:MAG: ComF family protein [Terriglobia bacterium]
MYEGTIKTVVREFKYGNNRGLARQLAELMVGELEIDRGCDVVTWVPMGRQKQAQRGYNQAELLGRALGKRLSVEAGSLIGLKRRLREQNSLPLSGREQNVKDAFEARADLHRLKIILADDVLTTGLTASACSGVLKRAGARAVNVITFARAPLG